jgi:hypothetical protein
LPPGLPDVHYPSGFPTRTVYACLMRATCPAFKTQNQKFKELINLIRSYSTELHCGILQYECKEEELWQWDAASGSVAPHVPGTNFHCAVSTDFLKFLLGCLRKGNSNRERNSRFILHHVSSSSPITFKLCMYTRAKVDDVTTRKHSNHLIKTLPLHLLGTENLKQDSPCPSPDSNQAPPEHGLTQPAPEDETFIRNFGRNKLREEYTREI